MGLIAKDNRKEFAQCPEGLTQAVCVDVVDQGLKETPNGLKHKVRVEGKHLDLTPKEFHLLQHFLLHAEEVVRRTELLEKVWDMTFDPGSNVVDVNVARLRKKLEAGGATISIVAKRGLGFVIDLSVSGKTPPTP